MRVRYPKKVYGPYCELSHQERDLNQFEGSHSIDERCNSIKELSDSITERSYSIGQPSNLESALSV